MAVEALYCRIEARVLARARRRARAEGFTLAAYVQALLVADQERGRK